MWEAVQLKYTEATFEFRNWENWAHLKGKFSLKPFYKLSVTQDPPTAADGAKQQSIKSNMFITRLLVDVSHVTEGSILLFESISWPAGELSHWWVVIR